MPIRKNASDKIYYKDYNIDDSTNQIMIIPMFLINLFRYTFFPNKIDPTIDKVNEIANKNTELPDVNSLILTQQIMSNIDDPRYVINSYFDTDANFYTLLTYFNNYLSFRTLINNKFRIADQLDIMYNSTHPQTFNSAEFYKYKLIEKNYDNKSDKSDTKNSLHSPCYISNFTNYYNEIKDLVNCKEQICGILNCTERNDLYIKYNTNPANYGNLPNCYCLPLLCYDDLTITNSIPDDFKELYEMVAKDNPNNLRDSIDYTPYSFLKLNTQCRMSFSKKHSVYKTFNYRLSLHDQRNTNYKYQESFIYLTSEIDQELIIDKAKTDINNIIIVISTSYSVLVALVLLFFLRSVLISIDKFKERIDSTSNIHRKILANSSIEMQRMTSEELQEDINPDNKECDENEEESKQLQKSVIQGFKKDNKSSNEEQLDQVSEKTRNMDNEIGVSPRNNINSKGKIKDEDRDKDEYQPEEENRFLDELEELFCIINDNMKDFTMDFDINKNIYLEYPIVKKYSNYLRKKIYSFAILPVKKDIFALKRKKKIEERSFIKEESKEYSESDDDESYRSSSNYSEENDLNKKINHNLSINILSELLSTEYIDIGEYNKNFYFRQSQQESLFNFYDFINTFLINDETYVSEITDPEKLATAFRYINYEIVQKWLDIFLQDKEIDEF